MRSKLRIIEPSVSICHIVPVGKRRDGGTRFWCLAHKADATAKYGRRAKECRAAKAQPVEPYEEFSVDVSEYLGGVALWGAVPPVYDTTALAIDRGIHVHARKELNGTKCMDRTYRAVRIQNPALSKSSSLISEQDAIYYMVSSIFGQNVKQVNCTYCGYSHLDKDWFCLHPHRRHLCAGCGKLFSDSKIGIGNPIAALIQRNSKSPVKVKKALRINQADFQGGIRLWGSNPAFVWTNPMKEKEGVHVHAYLSGSDSPAIDGTFGSVSIDGISLNPQMVRILMAQSALPHLEGRIISMECPKCNIPHLDVNEDAYTPKQDHICRSCGQMFKSKGRVRKVIINPLPSILAELATKAVRPPRLHQLGLLPEVL